MITIFFVDDCMINSNFGIGCLHVKRPILTYLFCDVISLLVQIFLVSFDRAYKGVSTNKYWKCSMSQFLWYDCTIYKSSFCDMTVPFTKAMYRPCDLDLCSLMFLLCHQIEYSKRCLWKHLEIFYDSVLVIWLYLQKPM